MTTHSFLYSHNLDFKNGAIFEENGIHKNIQICINKNVFLFNLKRTNLQNWAKNKIYNTFLNHYKAYITWLNLIEILL